MIDQGKEAMTDEDLHPGETTSPEKKVPSFRQSRVNPVGQHESDDQACTKNARNQGADPEPPLLCNPDDKPADTKHDYNQPYNLPLRRVFQKLRQLFFHLAGHPRTVVRLVCAYAIMLSIHSGMQAWFILTFVLFCTEVYVIVYLRNCMAGRTPLAPWTFCRSLHFLEDFLSLARNNPFLMALTVGLVVLNVCCQWQPPLAAPWPFALGLTGGAICAMAVTGEHLDNHEDALLWLPGSGQEAP